MCILAVAVGRGQEFEVVSIKPNTSMSGSSHSRTDQGIMTGINLSLRNLILRAYDIKDYQLEGPDWLGSEHFDISAKFPADLPKGREQYSAAFERMMQKMLADRFHLTVHHDQKTMGVYALVPARSGIKFTEAAAPGSSSSNSENSHYVGKSISMDRFAGYLSERMDLPVLDFTGLKGAYDLKLDWVAESRQSKDGDNSIPAGPALPEAIQDQLGLKLERRKAPVAIIVVDHAEKTPTEN